MDMKLTDLQSSLLIHAVDNLMYETKQNIIMSVDLLRIDDVERYFNEYIELIDLMYMIVRMD